MPALAATYSWLGVVGLSANFVGSTLLDSNIADPFSSRLIFGAFILSVAALNVRAATYAFRNWLIGSAGILAFSLICGSKTLLAIPFRSVGLADYWTFLVFDPSYQGTPSLRTCLRICDVDENGIRAYVLSSLGGNYVIRCDDDKSTKWLRVPRIAVISDHN